MQQTLYLGMPGSGKTTKLLQLLEQELKRTPAHQIAFVSFTKKAVTEAQKRCLNVLGISKNEMPFFKTLHALAFSAMGLKEHDVVSQAQLDELGEHLGINLATKRNHTNPIVLYNLSRSKQWSFSEAWHKTFFIHSKPFHQMAHVVREYERYKERHAIIDFTDMIINYNKHGAPLPVKVAFVDEAQDLSVLQWTMIKKAFCHAHTLIVAGDDDQCIYSWSGADRKHFLNFEGKKEILDVSYRCPNTVAALGNKISSRIQQRYAKALKGAGHLGEVAQINLLDEISSQIRHGEWLFLVRNRVDTAYAKRVLMQQGVSFSIDHRPICPPKHADAVLGYQDLLLGKRVSGSVAKNIAECAGFSDQFYDAESEYTGKDIFKTEYLKPDFREVLVGIIPPRLRYYNDVIQNKQQLQNPKIYVTTIHGSKGSECENVILVLDQSKLTYKSAQIYPDNEHRVFYVGVTRSKNKLFLLRSNTKYYYKL